MHDGPAVGDGNILLQGMFAHYRFRSQIDLDQFGAFFFGWGKWGHRVYIPQTCEGGLWKTAGEWSRSGSPGYDEKYPDILTSILQLVDMRFSFCMNNQWTCLEKEQGLCEVEFHRIFLHFFWGMDQVKQVQELISVTHLIFAQIVNDLVYHHILPIHTQWFSIVHGLRGRNTSGFDFFGFTFAGTTQHVQGLGCFFKESTGCSQLWCPFKNP